MAKYVFPAVFTQEENGLFAVKFPDLKGCYTSGDSLADAVEMAEDALCLKLYDMEENGTEIPQASNIADIQKETDSIVSLVACDTLEYRKFYDKKAVKKTLTIPNWLNAIAERAGVNFSAVLQEALIEKLHLS